MSVIIFILILAVLIVVHEYGHFIFAKKWGVRVDEFGLGYPPRAKTLFKRKGTLFTLNWIPFGGFVKIFGESATEEPLTDEEKKVSLAGKSRFAQGTIMFAGPLFNFIFAWFLILITILIGLPSAVTEDNSMYVRDVKTVIVDVLEGSPADLSGVSIGDSVRGISFNGSTFLPIQDINITEEINKSKTDVVLLELTQDSETVVKEVDLGDFMVDGERKIGIGFQEVGIYEPPFFRGFVESFSVAFKMIKDISLGLVNLVVDAFRGQADVSSLTGPVGIVSLVGDASSLGFVYLLTFVALISVNLGVINLIPFPALDGGRILFLIIESIIRRPINAKIANILNSVGFLILITLMLFITFKDVIRLF